MTITLDWVAGVGDAAAGLPKFGEAIVFGSPVPEPNEPEHEAIAAPSATQPAAAVKTRARVIARQFAFYAVESAVSAVCGT
ncbi:MAG TPA: hypothetical protein VGD01_00935 [Candidatus Elarobacter sp.]